MIDQRFMPRLILVAAPAGFGKTTLLTQWIARASESESAPLVAWASLEAEDSSAPRFLSDLVSAVEVASDGEIGSVTKVLVEGDRPTPAEDVLASLVNEFDDLANPLILALDDFHLADSAEVNEALAFLIDHLPPRVTLAMTSRSDPRLPLARLRSQGELLEIRAADLRFTPDEAGNFLTEVMGLQLEPDQISALESRTEGWAAGLQLAALSVRGRADSSPTELDAFIEEFTGSHRFVLDYLMEEVLNAEDQETRDFLLQTAVLDRMSGPLCDALTGTTTGQQILEQLESRNVFVLPLDDVRGWYRYHHLFADAMRARLLAQAPHQVAELHRAASEWYAQQGLFANAMKHAAMVKDDQLTAALVEAGLPELRMHRQDQTIIEWLSNLPDQVVRDRPILATVKAWTYLVRGDLANLERWLDAAEAVLDRQPPALGIAVPAEVARLHAEEARIVPANVAIYRASLGQAHGNVTATIENASRARDLAGPDDHLVHAASAGFLGLADWVEGDLSEARAKFEQTVKRLMAAGNVADALATTVPVAGMTVGLGEPNRAKEMFEQAIGQAEAHRGPVLASYADLHVGLADLLREQGDFADAGQHLEIARDLGDAASLPENRFRWYAVTSGLLRSTGDFDGALRMLDQAQSRYLPGYFPDVQPLAATRARILLSLGRTDDVQEWASGRQLSVLDEPTYRAAYELTTYARLLIAVGGDKARSSVELLDNLQAAAEAASRKRGVIEAQMVKALAHQALGDVDSAIRDLSAAVVAGVPKGFKRLFLDEGEPMKRLLERVVAASPEAAAQAAAQDLLGETRAPQEKFVVPMPFGPDALSERELEVLRLLPSNLTGPEIAARLYVSINTLRTHTKRIFTKLDVKTRRAAVTRAAELGLL